MSAREIRTQINQTLAIVCTLAGFIVSRASIANDCKDLRLDLPPGSMSTIPVYDQDSLGLCYAFAASQLVDAYRFSHGDGKRSLLTSPVVAAAQSGAAEWFRDDLDGGIVGNVVESIRKGGICDRDVVLRQWGGDDIKPYLIDLRKFFDAHRAYAKEHTSVVQSLRNLLSNEHENADIARNRVFKAQEIQCYLKRSVPIEKAQLPSIGLIGELLNQNDPIMFLSQIFKKTCEGHSTAVTVPEVTNVFLSAPFVKNRISESNDITKIIQARLSRSNPQPIAISYCAAVLTDQTYKGFERMSSSSLLGWKGDIVPKSQRPDCGNHASLVIGQRMNGGKCQFLVRNSWGSSCAGYSWPCQNGNIWIDSDRLAENIYKLSWLGD